MPQSDSLPNNQQTILDGDSILFIGVIGLLQSPVVGLSVVDPIKIQVPSLHRLS